MKKTLLIFALFAMLTVHCISADAPSISVSQSSIRINGRELRIGPKADAGRYISLSSIEKELGAPQDTYEAGLGVRVYSWPELGIQVQRGWRGPEKGKIFKFQVYFEDDYSQTEDKHSGKFSGHVQVEGLDITSNSEFNDIRPELEKAGFKITEYPKELNIIGAENRTIRIFTVNTTNRIKRLEIWCD